MSESFNQNLYDASVKALTDNGVPEELAEKASQVGVNIAKLSPGARQAESTANKGFRAKYLFFSFILLNRRFIRTTTNWTKSMS